MLKEEILKAASEYVASGEIPYLPMTGYENYLKNGNRLHFEKHYFARRRQLAVLILAYELKKDEKVKKLLEQVVWEVCNEYSWALPAHLPIVGDSFGKASEKWLDLFAAETAQTLGTFYERFGEDFSPLLQERIQWELEKRIFQPFEEHSWEWETKENNWSAVVGGGIGMGILSVLPESQRRRALIKRVDHVMESYLRGFGDDGACVEGVGYWAYGFGYFIYYCEKLAEVTGDTHYFDLPKVKNIASFPYFVTIGKNSYLPFSDYSNVALPSGLLAFCQKKLAVKVPAITESSLDFDDCYRFAHLDWNLKWPLEKNSQDETMDHYFPNAQWWIKKNSEIVFGAKGGNNEESHNHLDVGHFIFGTPDALFLTDLGAGEYTKDYFTDKTRYNYFVNNATSHSMPQINGSWQSVTSSYPQAKKEKNSLTFNLENLYPSEKLKSFDRKYSLRADELTIEDSFSFSGKNNQIKENFVTLFQPIIAGSKVKLSEKSKTCVMTFATETIEVIEKKYRNHQGLWEKAYLIQANYKIKEEGIIKTIINLV